MCIFSNVLVISKRFLQSLLQSIQEYDVNINCIKYFWLMSCEFVNRNIKEQCTRRLSKVLFPNFHIRSQNATKDTHKIANATKDTQPRSQGFAQIPINCTKRRYKKLERAFWEILQEHTITRIESFVLMWRHHFPKKNYPSFWSFSFSRCKTLQ